jgi:hypothetical protein
MTKPAAGSRRSVLVRAGKIVRWQSLDTYDAALKAAGLAA